MADPEGLDTKDVDITGAMFVCNNG